MSNYGNNQWGYSNKESARQTQIGNFLRTFPNSKRIGTDPDTYEMPIQIGSSKLFVKIFLDKNFPLQPPLIQVMALVSHPLLDHNMYVHHRDCDNWTSSCALVTVIMDIVKDFQSNPPKPRARKSTGPGNVQATNAANVVRGQQGSGGNVGNQGSGNMGNYGASGNQGQAGNYSEGDRRRSSASEKEKLTAPQQFQDLFQLDPAQLQNLVDNETELNDYARDHVMVRSLIDRHDEVLRENTEIATTTITGREELEVLSAKYKAAFEEYEKARSNTEELTESQEMVIQRFSRANVLQHLEDRIKEVQTQNRQVAKEGISNAVDVDEFLDKYFEERKLYHILNAKKIRYSLNDK
eukprot:CAMPEP_0114974186 /NCGR_PEP_ID=MMETSP0216-20121206/1380_1 /TAXON_ID=223996 /ORGANISM="Protocruzia adherens, Strain Boccale" /LENGTH=351 /DNA_ID=CAMNT_0002334781 /DNA_START=52 /DNA_END=1107 /DNA_ORIENTATION=+